jgi:putative phosphoesterase
MRIAVLSDIHGNLPALDAVLDHAAVLGAELVVNLGDILSGPLWPAETADRLMALDLPTIRGNHERQLLAGDVARMGESDAWTWPRLDPGHRAWLAALPTERPLAGGEIHACHGTPDSDLGYFLETVEPGGARRASDAEVAARAGDIAAPVILCGHTHRPRQHRLADGRIVVNPGSVGLPAYADDYPHPHVMETGSPHASYAMLAKGARGWEARLWAVRYDWEAAAARAEANDRPDWAFGLRTGRAMR